MRRLKPPRRLPPRELKPGNDQSLDANIFVSAIIKLDSNPGRILELVQNGDIELCVSPEILEELKATLAYPELKKFHRHDSKWIAAFIRDLSEMARTTPGKMIKRSLRMTLPIISTSSALLKARPISLFPATITLPA